MVATACHGINALTQTGAEAKAAGNLLIRFMAEKTIAQEARKWTELAAGRTVNVNQSVKSQRDVPRLDRLSPEKRAQLESLMRDLSSDAIIDVEFTEPRV